MTRDRGRIRAEYDRHLTELVTLGDTASAASRSATQDAVTRKAALQQRHASELRRLELEAAELRRRYQAVAERARVAGLPALPGDCRPDASSPLTHEVATAAFNTSVAAFDEVLVVLESAARSDARRRAADQAMAPGDDALEALRRRRKLLDEQRSHVPPVAQPPPRAPRRSPAAVLLLLIAALFMLALISGAVIAIA